MYGTILFKNLEDISSFHGTIDTPVFGLMVISVWIQSAFSSL